MFEFEARITARNLANGGWANLSVRCQHEALYLIYTWTLKTKGRRFVPWSQSKYFYSVKYKQEHRWIP